MEGLWNVKQLAAWAGVSVKKIYELVERGELPHLRVGHAIRFDPAKTRQHFEQLAARAVG